MSVFLSNVSDYIEPSMACVNPLFNGSDDLEKPPSSDDIAPNTNTNTSTNNNNTSKKKMSLNYEDQPPQQTEPSRPPPTISLSDCLACSGCVTSTESVLVNEQQTSALSDAVRRNQFVTFLLSVSSLVELQRFYERSSGKTLARRAVGGLVERRLRSFTNNECEVLTSDSDAVTRVWAKQSYEEVRNGPRLTTILT